MDPSLALLPLDPVPVAVDASAAAWRTAWLPLVIPLDALPAEQRARLLMGREDAPIAARVQAAFDAGVDAQAWAQLAHFTQPLVAPRGLEHALLLWSARESARLGLRATRAPVVAAGDDATPLLDAATGALEDVQSVLDPWPWPRWIGPVVLVPGDAAFDALGAGQAMVARPALPLLRVDHGAARARVSLARTLCRLALATTSPPATGWPPWLERGLCALCAARADNDLVSPRHLAGIRAAAGATAIAAALASPDPDEALAMAIVNPLLHPDRKAALPSLLDLLRNGAGSEGALRIAYGLTPQKLAEKE
jgi:hypothetical protein